MQKSPPHYLHFEPYTKTLRTAYHVLQPVSRSDPASSHNNLCYIINIFPPNSYLSNHCTGLALDKSHLGTSLVTLRGGRWGGQTEARPIPGQQPHTEQACPLHQNCIWYRRCCKNTNDMLSSGVIGVEQWGLDLGVFEEVHIIEDVHKILPL